MMVVLCHGTMEAYGKEFTLPPCEGKYKGKGLSAEELTTVLADHKAWLEDVNAMKVQADTPDARRANLCEARLYEANLQHANLYGANLQHAYFEPVADSLPVISSAARAYGLSEITFGLPFAAVELREAFKKAGLREQQCQLTRAINYTLTHQELDSLDKSEQIEAWFKLVMFEFPSQYGLYPGRPLRILGVLVVLFATLYSMALLTSSAASIWLVWSPDRIHKGQGQDTPVRVTDELLFSRWAGTHWELMVYSLQTLWVAFYFSLLSAFSIGWRELNVGTWLSRLQPREYTLRATGWVRVVAGVQSLLSVYLVALWALTYFGNPFE